MDSWKSLETADGSHVPIWRFSPLGAKAHAVFLMLPALGVRARIYRRLAEGLAGKGIETVLLEQRGHGESPYRAHRGMDFGYKDYLHQDIAAAVAWLRAEMPEVPLYIGGHSLGGHLSSIAAARLGDKIAGVVHLACGFPYHGLFPRQSAQRIKKLCLLLPLLTVLFGYYPGKLLGFGEREFRRLMLDWRDWARGGSYDIPATPSAEAQIAAYRGRVLSIAFDRDSYASDAAISYSHGRFHQAIVTVKKLTEIEQGDHLGHFDWAKKPTGVVECVAAWMTKPT